MPDIDTIIAKWKASFAGRTRYEGQEPREDELLVAEVERLQRDAARLDWLADVDNPVGNVQLPREAVLANLDDMRAAIDEAMRYEPHPTEPGMYRRKETPHD